MPRKTRSCFLMALSPLWPCPFIRRCSVISCIGWSWSADGECMDNGDSWVRVSSVFGRVHGTALVQVRNAMNRAECTESRADSSTEVRRARRRFSR